MEFFTNALCAILGGLFLACMTGAFIGLVLLLLLFVGGFLGALIALF